MIEQQRTANAVPPVKAPDLETLRTGDRILILNNPGDFTRNYLQDMGAACERLGLRPATLELSDIWSRSSAGTPIDWKSLAENLHNGGFRAAISTGHNGVFDLPMTQDVSGRKVPFLQMLGIPHIQWWTDHPHWAHERVALSEQVQPALRSENHHVFVKCELAAGEIRQFLKWPHVYGLPVAENPDRLKPARDVSPDCDVVAVVGSPPELDPDLKPFLKEDDPDVSAMSECVAAKVRQKLSSLWAERGPANIQNELNALGDNWVAARATDALTGSFRVFCRLEPQYPQACSWIRENYRVYFDALHILWDFGRWQRTFTLAYLARYFRVRVLGNPDWSSLELGGSPRIPHDAQPATYASGTLGINISQCNDEEGITHKPFQMAACGVPMIHIERKGLSDCFAPDEEFMAFLTPREARDAVTALLDDRERREAMAFAARNRVICDHTWDKRLVEIFHATGLPLEAAC